MRFITGAADRRAFEFEFLIECVQYAHCLLDDFRADAVAGEDCNFHRFFLFAGQRHHGAAARPVTGVPD